MREALEAGRGTAGDDIANGCDGGNGLYESGDVSSDINNANYMRRERGGVEEQVQSW